MNKIFPKRLIAATLCFLMLFLNAAPFVLAELNISGINPTSVNGHSVYDIEAAKISGNTGFRQYEKFELVENDVANLLFKKGSNEYANFVNLVNNQVNINSIVNTMRDGGFYNGHAIFVSPDALNAINGSTRSDYKISGGHYIADNAFIGVDTDSANNNGLVFDTIYADDAKVITNNTKLTVKEGFIDNYATFINGKADAAEYNHKAVVDNRERKELVDAQYQMYTKKTGDFRLGMDDTIILKTNAPVVHYDPNLLVNTYHSENSFTRATLKENIVQQTTKDMYKSVSFQDIDSRRAKYVKLDTSNIITKEIENYSISQESDTSEENINISLEQQESIGG